MYSSCDEKLQHKFLQLAVKNTVHVSYNYSKNFYRKLKNTANCKKCSTCVEKLQQKCFTTNCKKYSTCDEKLQQNCKSAAQCVGITFTSTLCCNFPSKIFSVYNFIKIAKVVRFRLIRLVQR